MAGSAWTWGRALVAVVPLRRRYRLADVPCALPGNRVSALLCRRMGTSRMAEATTPCRCLSRPTACAAARLERCDWVTSTGRTTRCHLRAQDLPPRPMPLTRLAGEAVLDDLLRGVSPVTSSGGLSLQPPVPRPTAQQDQPLVGTRPGEGGDRDPPPRSACLDNRRQSICCAAQRSSRASATFSATAARRRPLSTPSRMSRISGWSRWIRRWCRDDRQQLLRTFGERLCRLCGHRGSQRRRQRDHADATGALDRFTS